MPQFTVNPTRTDPYKNFKFRVLIDGRIVAGVSRVSALVRDTEVVEHRVGGELNTVRRMPGRTRFEPITLERGVTHDIEFEQWAAKVWDANSLPGAESSLKDFRKNIVLQLLNEAGQVAKAWRLFRCWVSRFQALPVLDANANAIAIESITLQNEGWERDYDVPEPLEPTLNPVPAAAGASAPAPSTPEPAATRPKPPIDRPLERRPPKKLTVEVQAPTVTAPARKTKRR
jgi:phage tail-like protein